MIKKVEIILHFIIFFICAIIVMGSLYFFIRSLLSSESILGGIFAFFRLIYKYICVITFYIIQHGWYLYIIGLVSVILSIILLKKRLFKEIIALVLLLGVWVIVKICYNNFIYNSLANVKADIDSVALTVVALNDEFSIIVLNVFSLISGLIAVVVSLRSIFKILDRLSERQVSINEKENIE